MRRGGKLHSARCSSPVTSTWRHQPTVSLFIFAMASKPWIHFTPIYKTQQPSIQLHVYFIHSTHLWPWTHVIQTKNKNKKTKYKWNTVKNLWNNMRTIKVYQRSSNEYYLNNKKYIIEHLMTCDLRISGKW